MMNPELREKIAGVMNSYAFYVRECGMLRTQPDPKVTEEFANKINEAYLSHFQGAGLTEEEIKRIVNGCSYSDYMEHCKAIANAATQKARLVFEAEKQAAISEVVKPLEERIKQLKDGSLTYCVYCGMEFLIDDQAGSKVIEHINTCEKHPLFKANQRIKELEAELESLQKE